MPSATDKSDAPAPRPTHGHTETRSTWPGGPREQPETSSTATTDEDEGQLIHQKGPSNIFVCTRHDMWRPALHRRWRRPALRPPKEDGDQLNVGRRPAQRPGGAETSSTHPLKLSGDQLDARRWRRPALRPPKLNATMKTETSSTPTAATETSSTRRLRKNGGDQLDAAETSSTQR